MEREWLYDQRIRAMNACPDLEYQRWRKSQDNGIKWLSALRIYHRDKDGSLLAAVVIKEKGTGLGYKRKLRTPAILGSTSTRGIHLRRAHRAS